MPLLLPFGRITARGRRLVARHRSLRWMPVLAASLAVVSSVTAHHRRIDAERRAWGDTVAVWTAAGNLAPGDPLVAQRREVPVALVPDDVFAAEAIPDDQVARQHVADGTIITAVDVAAGGGPEALIPIGWRGVPIDEITISGASVGDRVDVVSDGIVVATSALVIRRDGGAMMVAVPADAAPLVALANQSGVALLRIPPGEGELRPRAG